MMRKIMTTRTTMAAALIATSFASAGAMPQTRTPEELAARLTGTWILNRELTTGFRAPARRGGPSTTLRPSGPLFQRRGGRGGGRESTPSDPSDLTPEQRAEQAAMRQLEQISERLTITASGKLVTFADARGERTYAIDGKVSKIEVGGSAVSVKSKWDKNVLKQEFSNTQAKLVQTWGIDDAGRLVLTAKLESMTLVTPEQKAVFDHQ
jgi:hypothetical protein